MKVLIINYNRLTLLKNTVEWCIIHGLEPIVIDNNSDFPPLLQYYNECDCPVMRMKKNYGHKVIWECNIIKLLNIKGRYIITDPDLDFTGIPSDFLDVLNHGLDKYHQYNKVGFSLEINDLPSTKYIKDILRGHEIGYWKTPLDDMYFDAPIDTTFAMYREGVNEYFHPAIRTNRPYTARHIPWYYKNKHSLPDDEKYYFRTCNASSSIKNRI